VLEQPDVVRVRGLGGEPDPRLGDVGVDVEASDLDGSGHPVAVVVVDGEPVLVDEQVVLDPLDLVEGESLPTVAPVDLGRPPDDVRDVVRVGPDEVIGLLRPQLGPGRARRPESSAGLPRPAVEVVSRRSGQVVVGSSRRSWCSSVTYQPSGSSPVSVVTSLL
jgi:hypothetical protein